MSSSRDAHSILHTRLKSKVVELTFLGKVGDTIVGSNEQPFDLMLAKPLVVDFGPVLLSDFHAWDVGELLSSSAVFGSCEGKNAVR
jgi:hypothetical protein